MQRRYLLAMAPLLPLALFASRFFGARMHQAISPKDLRQQALQLDQLASNIHTVEDARRLVDFVAGIFDDKLPPTWMTQSVRDLTARAEYLAVVNPAQRIPEERIADAWNAYLATIGAPETSRVNPAEIHNLRNGLFTSARLFQNLDRRNIWAVSAIYATQPDGSLASGCRAIESVRILWDLATMPDNLQDARQRVQQGVLISDEFRQQLDNPHPSYVNSVHAEVRRSRNPVEAATKQYVDTNGARAYNNAVSRMLTSLMSASA